MESESTHCMECQHPMEVTREDYRYAESGLPTVTLVALERRRCTHCSEAVVSIPRLDSLHALMARLLALKVASLTGPEVRFLRTWLGLPDGGFPSVAPHQQPSPSLLEAWELGTMASLPMLERALRLAVMERLGERSTNCPWVPTYYRPPLQVRLRWDGAAWVWETPPV